MITTVQRWGNSLAIRIPRAFALHAELDEHTEVDISLDGNTMVVRPIKGYPFEVVIPEGLPLSGAVLSDQVRSLDWKARKASRICVLPVEITDEVLGKLQALLERRR